MPARPEPVVWHWTTIAGGVYSLLLISWSIAAGLHPTAAFSLSIRWEALPLQAVVLMAVALLLRDRIATGARAVAWKLVGLGFALNFVGSWLWIGEGVKGATGYGPSDALFCGCILANALAAGFFYVDLGGSFRNRRVWLDVATLVLAIAAMLWQVWMRPALDAGRYDERLIAALTAYGVSYTALLSMATLAYMQITDWRLERSLAFLMFGALASFLADFLWVDVDARQRFMSVSWNRFAYCAGEMILLLALDVERARRMPHRAVHRLQPMPPSALPSFCLVVSMAVILASSWTRSVVDIGLPLGVAVLGAMLVALREVDGRVQLLRFQSVVRRRETQLRALGIVDHVSDAILVIDAQHRVGYATPSVVGMLAHAPGELTGQYLHTLFGESNQMQVDHLLHQVGADGHFQLEIEIDAPLSGRGGRVLQIAGKRAESTREGQDIVLTVRDVTLEQTAERELRAASLQSHLALSREIHESVAQELTGISLLVQTASSNSAADRRGDADVLASVSSMIAKLVDQVRALAARLSPLYVAGGSLPEAVRMLAMTMRRSRRLEVRVTSDPTAAEVQALAAEETYRLIADVLEEIAAAHLARDASVGLMMSEDWLHVNFRFRCEIDAAASMDKLLGILRNHATHLRADLDIDGEAGSGFDIALDIPLRRET